MARNKLWLILIIAFILGWAIGVQAGSYVWDDWKTEVIEYER